MPAQVTQATKATRAERTGEPTQVYAMLPSEFIESEYADDDKAFVIVVPDNGASAFDPMHKDKAGKEVKAKFVVADLKSEGGRGVAPILLVDRNLDHIVAVNPQTGKEEPQQLAMANGEHALIPLGITLYIQAIPPNVKGLTIDEALNRNTNVTELKTGTNN